MAGLCNASISVYRAVEQQCALGWLHNLLDSVRCSNSKAWSKYVSTLCITGMGDSQSFQLVL